MASAEHHLARLIKATDATPLLIADDNLDIQQLPRDGLGYALTHRWDQHQQLRSAGWKSQFCDYQWPGELPDNLHLFYRIAKEKAIVHRVLNLAVQNLPSKSRITLIGRRNEGIKSLAKRAQSLLGGSKNETKLDAEFWQVDLSLGNLSTILLDDSDYTQIRPVAALEQHTLYSKPGVFGWNKIDQGSYLLVQQLCELMRRPLPLQDLHTLDLGCGSGYLSLVCCSPTTRLTATDNNAAALIATQYNLSRAGFTQAEVVASDAGDLLKETYDLILCNPPFHSGFSVDQDLTTKFVQSAARLLNGDGRAVFVVNQHIPLGRVAQPFFRDVSLVINDGHFCVYSLTQPVNRLR